MYQLSMVTFKISTFFIVHVVSIVNFVLGKDILTLEYKRFADIAPSAGGKPAFRAMQEHLNLA